MKKKFKLAMFFIYVTFFAHSQSGSIGINTSSPTKTLDINGQVRIRDLPVDTGIRNFILISDSIGNLFRKTNESIRDIFSSKEGHSIKFISGDTIEVGSIVALGNGITGINTSGAYSVPLYELAIPDNNYWFGQTFRTRTGSFAIKEVELHFLLVSTTPATPFVCSIRNVSALGIPVGSDLGGQSPVAYSDIGSGSSGGNMRFVFNPPLDIFPDSLYAIIVRLGTSFPFDQIQRTTSDIYTQGNMLSSSNSGSSWTVQNQYDLWFSVYETFTEAGKIYNSVPVPGGSIGWNITSSCNAAAGTCPSDFYGKNDRYDNVLGIALNNAMPGDTVQVQLSGFTDKVTGFPLGRKLYLGSPPGSLSLTGTKSVGISTGDGMVIQIDY